MPSAPQKRRPASQAAEGAKAISPEKIEWIRTHGPAVLTRPMRSDTPPKAMPPRF